ncbi:hypothetical protein FY034_15225 [Trichlorobacter lovleyi]|uniref:hypothetical protein n=1 Tax=Trichlorobacter lovleyi TaxID=313985 RepID=UPI0022406E87|nr:hypothetical protein [Trichlorobacter lovleyi]QOX80229.1 hypothetical protein FY034_15225 [Trichlorobacter lovleyi]
MRPFQLTLIILILFVSTTTVLATPKMRPYSGIGVLQISSVGVTDAIRLYSDPGIGRCCKVETTAIKELNGWLFGEELSPSLLVTARKGDWLEVEHDDAGRSGWIMQERRWIYTPWEQYLKGKLALFLRNSPKKMTQVLPRPGAAEGTPLKPKQPMKIILAQGDWAYVLLDQNSAGWIRWRDSDGRLLVGFDVPLAK